MKTNRKLGPKKSFRQYYADLGMVQKNLWMNADTVYRLEVYAARQSKNKKHHISFIGIVNEILDAKARELPDK